MSSSHVPFQTHLGPYQSAIAAAHADLIRQKILERIWRHDHTVWKPEPTEIANRLGWLHSPEAMQAALPEIDALVAEVRAAGYTHALLLGMGGSSLAPEVFRFTFGVRPGYLDLAVLDSTHPAAVLQHARRLDFNKTLFIVSTKSGGTVETFSFFKYFYNEVMKAVGRNRAGEHFIAITDPGSGLADTARTYKFRKTFLNDPNIGGRYSALSYFGLVPAALLGVNLDALLERARAFAHDKSENNSGLWLGAILGELAIAGCDKVTLMASPAIASFGAWAEQLIAESTGKEGQGILPVVEEKPGPPLAYANDRLFVYLRLQNDRTHDAAIASLAQAGHPVVQIDLSQAHDLGAEFFRWELATIIAGRRLGINPFDQPNVESAKVLARKVVAEFQAQGKLPELTPVVKENGLAAYADFPASTLAHALKNFLAQTGKERPRGYVALHAYLAPNPAADEALQSFAAKLRDQYRLATTIGYGPRFLHSTGQLHKGDAGNGRFIQFTANVAEDAPIPDQAGEESSSMSFGTLLTAQALGDRQALWDNRRKVLRLDLGKEAAGGLEQLQDMI
jgi:glucose-6-phosphate isomerase